LLVGRIHVGGRAGGHVNGYSTASDAASAPRT
jgi:hypothetical protein